MIAAKTFYELNNQELYQILRLRSEGTVEEMKEFRIPASITLAQGILESGNGESRLATEGNNHFGIKCHNSWDGETIIEDAMQMKQKLETMEGELPSWMTQMIAVAASDLNDARDYLLNPTTESGIMYRAGVKKYGKKVTRCKFDSLDEAP